MCLDDGHSSFRLAGKVVEIVEEGGHRKVKVSLEPWAVFDLGPDDVKDLHLGERLGLEAALVHVARATNGHAHAHPHDHGHGHEHSHSHPHPNSPNKRTS